MNNKCGHWLNSARHTRCPNERTMEMASGAMLWHIPRVQISQQWLWPLRWSSGTAQKDNNKKIISGFRRGQIKSPGKPTGNQVSCNNIHCSSMSINEENGDKTIVNSHPCTDKSQTETCMLSPDSDPVQCSEDPVVEAQTAPSSCTLQDDVTNSAKLSWS